jgi:superfamily II DNA/RNA helicase
MMSASFEQLQIEERWRAKLEERGIRVPTEVQAAAIPHLLQGGDVIAESPPGTGKTFAYLLPILQRLDPTARELQALILAPTRELAMQIAGEAQWLGDGVRIAALIGGASLRRQLDKLKEHPQLVVGTPGRIAELIELRKLKMHRVRTIVVDEADQMLALGSGDDLRTIVGRALRDRQLAFFSATLTAEAERLAREWMREPLVVRVQPEQRTAAAVEHVYMVGDKRERIELVRKLMRAYRPPSAILFVSDTDAIGRIEAKLKYAGFSVVSLYGDSDKQDRALAMARFRDGRARLLIATDVAARGLDLPDVSLVIHYDPPTSPEQYVHRSGRTGRAGRDGVSVLLLAPHERKDVLRLARKLGIDLAHKALREGRVVDGGEVPAPRGRSAARRAHPGPEPAARSRDGAAPRARPVKARPGLEAPKAPPVPPSRKKERAIDRKNKGAPRWLKNKP